MYNEVFRTRYRIGVLSEVEYRQARARAHWWVWQIDVVWRNAIKHGTGNYGRCPDVCTLQKIEVSCRRYEGDWYCWYTETGNYGHCPDLCTWQRMEGLWRRNGGHWRWWCTHCHQLPWESVWIETQEFYLFVRFALYLIVGPLLIYLFLLLKKSQDKMSH